jgi:cytochrome c
VAVKRDRESVQNLVRRTALPDLGLAFVLWAPAGAFAGLSDGVIEQQHGKFCHTTEGADLAPSFPQIAQRYRTSAAASAMLENKLLIGGKPRWGDITMPEADAAPPLSSDDVHALIQWVLSR